MRRRFWCHIGTSPFHIGSSSFVGYCRTSGTADGFLKGSPEPQSFPFEVAGAVGTFLRLSLSSGRIPAFRRARALPMRSLNFVGITQIVSILEKPSRRVPSRVRRQLLPAGARCAL